MTDNEPFFRQEGDTFQPLPPARGPWNPQSLNGRAVAALIGCELERRHGEEGFIPARMTTDLYRLPGFDPIRIETRVVRSGRRIRVVDVEFFSAGTSMARSTCQMLALGENAAGEVWTPAPWEVPAPETLEARMRPGPPWEVRPIDGEFGQAVQRRTWVRENRETVGGVPTTPWQRVAAACDFVSPTAHSGSEGLGYINTDITLQVHRLPRGEWVGFESTYHGADGGVALGECRLYDEQGPIGLASCLALAQKQAIGRR